MQTLIQTRKVEDEKRKQVILEILADQYCKQILQTIMDKPKSVTDIKDHLIQDLFKRAVLGHTHLRNLENGIIFVRYILG